MEGQYTIVVVGEGSVESAEKGKEGPVLKACREENLSGKAKERSRIDCGLRVERRASAGAPQRFPETK
jgi:hypothetical protein